MEHICGSNPLMESALRKTLRANVKATMDAGRMVQADLHAAVSKGSAHRVTAGQNVTLDVLQAVAKALKIPAWALLHPDFDAKNPLVIQTAAQIEAESSRFLPSSEVSLTQKKPDPTDALLLSLTLLDRLQRESRPTKTRRKVKPRAKVGGGKNPPKGGTQ